jgi:hypothetical protein
MGIRITDLTTRLLIHNEEEKSIKYMPKEGAVLTAVKGIVLITNGTEEFLNADPDKIDLPAVNGLLDLVQVLDGYLQDNPKVGFKLPNQTTTERNALTPESGFIIFNSTDSVVQFYNGSTWINT